MKSIRVFCVVGVMALPTHLHAAIRYVWANSPTPTAPYTNWATAAHTIQDAVDVAVSNDFVFVTNGTYAAGGHVSPGGLLTSRVVVVAAVTLQSVNGPDVTSIVGGNNIRCAFLDFGATLSGFTLTNGDTLASGDSLREQSGGGVYGGRLTNCAISRNFANYYGGGACSAILYNCTISFNTGNISGGGAYLSTLYNCKITKNYAGSGGGVAMGTAHNCTISSNTADVGGGAAEMTLFTCNLTSNTATHGGGNYGGLLYNCNIASNRAALNGGGAAGCVLYQCTIAHNSANAGGGMLGSEAYNCIIANNLANSGGGTADGSIYGCTLQSNSASNYGGGAWYDRAYGCNFTSNQAAVGGGASDGILYNCELIANSADSSGGGVCYGEAYNCTFYSNAAYYGGGACYGTLVNCIAVNNESTVLGDIYGASCWNSCSPVLSGNGNITNVPMFVNQAGGDFRLQSDSPCINTGTNQDWMATTNDLDGNPRIVGPFVDMGAYEYALTPSGVNGAWLVTNGLPADGSADGLDGDGDSMDTAQEYMAGTDPNSGMSRLAFEDMSAQEGGPSGVVVRWQSVTGKRYNLLRGTNLTDSPIFGTTVATNITGQAPMNTVTDSAAIGPGPWFYRVTIE